jgi:hypothetical protein
MLYPLSYEGGIWQHYRSLAKDCRSWYWVHFQSGDLVVTVLWHAIFTSTLWNTRFIHVEAIQ